MSLPVSTTYFSRKCHYGSHDTIGLSPYVSADLIGCTYSPSIGGNFNPFQESSSPTICMLYASVLLGDVHCFKQFIYVRIYVFIYVL